MLVDTHCHINTMVKKTFDIPLQENDFAPAQEIIMQASAHDVSKIINVATSLVESLNCVALAKQFENVWATVGIHPNDCKENWRHEMDEIKKLVHNKQENKIVGIGECGIDKHYKGYNLDIQFDAFRMQIELALENDLAIVIHSRDAADETLKILDEYKDDIKRGVIHCFSYDQSFADAALEMNFVLGIGGTITYPRNEILRDVVKNVGLQNIVLETDAPFLPPQIIRGKKNHPLHIKTIAHYVAQLLDEPYETVAQITTKNAFQTFQLEKI